jgi:hypothetical protein
LPINWRRGRNASRSLASSWASLCASLFLMFKLIVEPFYHDYLLCYPNRRPLAFIQFVDQWYPFLGSNNISGDNNVTGNANQTGMTVIAPNGIVITRGTVTNPTVNNYGPPAVQLMWSVADAPTEAPAGKFAKVVIVKSNTSYSPIFIASSVTLKLRALTPLESRWTCTQGISTMTRRSGF